MGYLYPIMALNAIAVPIAVILVVANRLFAEYEDVTLDVNDGEEEFVVEGGTTLLEALKEHEVDIRAACGGQGSCGYCKVKVKEGGGPVLPTEEPLLTREELVDGTRLSCQVQAREDMKITIPDYLTTVREIVENELYDPTLRWKFDIADRRRGSFKEEGVEAQIEEDEQAKLHEIVEEYGKGPGSLLPILQEVNNKFNYLPESVLARLSGDLDIPLSHLYKLATFYNSFNLKPRGEHEITVCLGTACHVKGGESIIQNFEDRLGIDRGETTEDTLFNLKGARCLGTCGLAPVVMVDEDVYGEVSPKQVPDIIEKYKGAKVHE
ncbi:MAG: NAD(P)H-dependent oxidoreductase subunit E [Candidatus Bipolaricaulota bacterium]